jgi:anti-sigma regulatory factor (Ser/Thr protein kinase)
MPRPVVTTSIETEDDVVVLRQQTRRIAELLGFERQDQTRIATAVSEIARNAFVYAGGGRAAILKVGIWASLIRFFGFSAVRAGW